MSTMRANLTEKAEPRQRYQASPLAQLVDLFLIELTNWRWSWRSMLLTGTLAPVFSILGMGVFAQDAGHEALGYVLTGNMVISLMFGNMRNVQSHFTFMRFEGALDYYATLPIRKHNLILAVVLSFLLLSLPSLIITMLLGTVVLKVPITFHPLALRYLIDLVGVERIMIGSDYPFDMGPEQPVLEIINNPYLSDQEKEKVIGKNAQVFFRL